MIWLRVKITLKLTLAAFLFFVADVLSGEKFRKHRDRKLVNRLYHLSSKGMLCWAASAHSNIFNLEYNDLEFMVSLTGRAKEEVQLRITRPGSPIFYTILVTDVPKLSALFCLLRKIDRGETTDDFKEFNRQITSTIRL